MPGSDGNGLLLRSRRHALQLVVRIDPRDCLAVGCRAGQTGIVKDGAGVLLCADYGFGVNEPAAGVNGEAQVSLERPRRQSVEDDGTAPALTLDADFFPFPNGPERLMGAAGRIVEERVPPLLAQVPDADGHKRRRVDLPEQRGGGTVSGRSNAQFFDQGFFLLELEDQYAVLALRNGPGDAQARIVLTKGHSGFRLVGGEVHRNVAARWLCEGHGIPTQEPNKQHVQGTHGFPPQSLKPVRLLLGLRPASFQPTGGRIGSKTVRRSSGTPSTKAVRVPQRINSATSGRPIAPLAPRDEDSLAVYLPVPLRNTCVVRPPHRRTCTYMTDLSSSDGAVPAICRRQSSRPGCTHRRHGSRLDSITSDEMVLAAWPQGGKPRPPGLFLGAGPPTPRRGTLATKSVPPGRPAPCPPL